jgi:hypothetical protein
MGDEEYLTPRERRFLEANPEAVRVSESQNVDVASGIEGWLLFLIVSLQFLGPLATILMTLADLNEAATLYPEVVGTPLWKSAQLIAWASTGLFCMISVFAGFTLAKKLVPSSVTVAIVCLWLAGPVLAAGTLFATSQVGVDASASDVGSAVMRPFIWATIWTVYLFRSKRVRNTYLGGRPLWRVRNGGSGLSKRSRQLIFFSVCWLILSFFYFMLMSPFGDYPSDAEVHRTWAIIFGPPVILILGYWAYSRFVGTDD